MSERDDGGAAFPAPASPAGYGFGFVTAKAGMSLRDWFAGQALSGLTAHTAVGCEDILRVERAGGIAKLIAQAAYEYADALLAERAK